MDVGIGNAISTSCDLESQAMDIFEAGHKIRLIREAIENATRSPEKAFQYLQKLRENVPAVPVNSRVKLNFISEILPTDESDQSSEDDCEDCLDRVLMSSPSEHMDHSGSGDTGGASGGDGNGNGKKTTEKKDSQDDAKKIAQLSKQEITANEQRDRNALVEQWRVKQKVVNKRVPYSGGRLLASLQEDPDAAAEGGYQDAKN